MIVNGLYSVITVHGSNMIIMDTVVCMQEERASFIHIQVSLYVVSFPDPYVLPPERGSGI